MQIVIYAGLILVGVLLAVLLLIGVLDVVRGSPIRAVGIPGDPTGCPSIGDPFFSDAIELLTKVKLQPGHTVEIFINGDQTYDRLWEDLRSAKTSITMQMYYCNKGHMADELHRILSERARAGVDVYFLFDSFGTSLPKEYFETLRDAGAHTTPFRPVSIRSLQKAQHRAHIRVVVVDGRIGYTGGFGIDDKWYGTGRAKDQWRDSNVRFVGPAVRQLQATFVVCWAEACGRLLTSEKLFPALDGGDPELAASGVCAAVLHASPTIGSTTAERFFVLSIAAAKERLYIANSYFVPDKAFRQLLCDAAGRGVDVRVLTTSNETDVKSTWYAGRARYEELFKGGVKIYEYQPAMMHAKTIVVDGEWMSVGSMNADNRSMSFNEESNLVVLDKGAGKKMEELFLDDLKYSEWIDPVEFAKRSIFARIAERACHLVWRVL
ncbi:MAG TPA: phospholipase D-like domain-containing protein [Gemmatimonadaceae bacterium]|nr:phospholipase D-like domain-containing protein [Gemmatimonadaceae bacterium]